MIRAQGNKILFIPPDGSSLPLVPCELLRLERCPCCGGIVRAYFAPPNGKQVPWYRYGGGFQSVVVPGYQGLVRVERCCQADLFASLSLRANLMALARAHFPHSWQELREFSPQQMRDVMATLTQLLEKAPWCGIWRGRDECSDKPTSLLAFDPEGDEPGRAREFHARLVTPFGGAKRFQRIRTGRITPPIPDPEKLPSGQLRLF